MGFAFFMLGAAVASVFWAVLFDLRAARRYAERREYERRRAHFLLAATTDATHQDLVWVGPPWGFIAEDRIGWDRAERERA